MKLRYTFIIILLALGLDACRTYRDYRKPEAALAAYIPERVDLSGSPALPSSKPFAWNLPVKHLEEEDLPDLPKVDITEDFCYREMNHVRVGDARLFASTDKIFIDLQRLRNASYSFPLPGARLLSPFGGRRKNHAGVDLKTFANDTVRAAFDGIVRMSKDYAGYGNVVVIRHYNGLETVYSHNSRNLVKPGTRIRTGQAIALMGRTGRATTEHLHFETRINGRAFNPALIFDLKTEKLQDNILMCTKKKNNYVEVVSVQRVPPSLAAMNEAEESVKYSYFLRTVED
jgi:hypothetical protein